MRLSRYFLLSLPVAVVALLYGVIINRITVYNNTGSSLAIATYRLEKKGASLVDGPAKVEVGGFIKLTRPSLKVGASSELAFVDSSNEAQLTDRIAIDAWMSLSTKNVGRLKGWGFVVSQQGGKLVAVGQSLKEFLSLVGSQVGSSLSSAGSSSKNFLLLPFKKAVKKAQPAIINNAHKKDTAYVRRGNSLCAKERRYCSARIPVVKKALQKFAGTPLGTTPPTIAFCCSGGGYRAMLGMTGSLIGAQEIGLLDAVMYTAGLSGSTWALGMWHANNLSVDQLRAHVKERLKKNIKKPTVPELRKIIDSVLVKWSYGEPVTLVDLYGGLLSNCLLGNFKDEAHRVYLSTMIKSVARGKRPLPIYTSISGKEESYLDRIWYEYTPYEVGSPHFGMYVPTWSYGRAFKKGASVNNAPEQSFGYLLGTFGSAFALTLGRVFEDKKGKAQQELIADLQKSYPNILKGVIQELVSSIFKVRISAAKTYNFMYGVDNSDIAKKEELSFVDAGLAFNLPYPPISGQRPDRRADIIFFLDYSATLNGAPEFRKVEDYARSYKLKFPSIDYTNIGSRSLSIFKDENDPSVPLVIYMPRCSDSALLARAKKENSYPALVKLLDGFDANMCVKESFCSTFNFDYSQANIDQFTSLTEFNMVMNADAIKEAVAWKINQLNPQK